MPAAFCGVYGIKPSYGRVPYYPMSNNDHLSHVGPITRTVADAALMLRVMAGPDDRDQGSLESPPEDYLSRLDEGIAGLRIAYSPDLGHLPVDREVAEVVAAAVRAFEASGYPVEEVDPGWGDPTEMEHCIWTTMIAGNAGPCVAKWRDHMDPGLLACIEDGHRYSAVDFFRYRAERNALYRKVREFFERYDLLLTPTLSVAAFPAPRLIPEHWEQHPWDWIRWAGFSYPFNLTWMPAASCPCGFTADGRPVGLQIAAGRFRDLRVLRPPGSSSRSFPGRSIALSDAAAPGLRYSSSPSFRDAGRAAGRAAAGPRGPATSSARIHSHSRSPAPAAQPRPGRRRAPIGVEREGAMFWKEQSLVARHEPGAELLRVHLQATAEECDQQRHAGTAHHVEVQAHQGRGVVIVVRLHGGVEHVENGHPHEGAPEPKKTCGRKMSHSPMSWL